MQVAVRSFAMSHVVAYTTDEQRNLLRAAGYVHVTGLTATNSDRPIGHNLAPRDLGRHNSNNSTDVIITLGGEVWVASHTNDSLRKNGDKIRQVQAQLCPNGVGGWVPCSNGEQISHRDLLMRVSDPDYEPR